jgi:hypothetical protein
MSLSISSSLPSLLEQQSLVASSSRSSSSASAANLDDTYTPSADLSSSTASAIHQAKNEISVNVDTALSAQKDSAISTVLSIFGI